MFIAALFPIARLQKQPRCPPVDERIKKMRYIYSTKHFLAIKENEILPLAKTRMDLEGILLGN